MYYIVGRGLYRMLFRTVFRYRVEGRENVPETGGVLLVANHASLLDPPLVGSAMRRPVHFMAKAELFRIPGLGFALPRVLAFPVERDGADRTAVRKAITLLKEGGVVGLFPEGTRTSTGDMLPFERGAGLIALKAKVPVVPVGLEGTFRPFTKSWIRPRQFTVRFGPALDFSAIEQEASGREAIDRANELMLEGIKRLLPEEPQKRS